MALEELGRYRIVERLGDNALGEVYLGMDPLLKRPVTIQTARVDRAALAGDEERLLAELKAVERLSHPGIATVYDSGLAGDLAYIATERPEGRDLRELIAKDKPIPAELAVELVASVADGLAYAHRRNVLHQNVAPGQITVLPNGGVKLSGFGLAALQQVVKRSEPLLGATEYLAPEQFSGKRSDARTDLFSLAVVFYQLITGRLPFGGGNPAEVMYRVMRKPARWPSRVARPEHRGYYVILAQALAKQPDDRYQNIGEFAADLRRASELADRKARQWPTGGLASRRSDSGHKAGDDAERIGTGRRMLRPLLYSMAAGIVLAAGLYLAKPGLLQNVPAPQAAVASAVPKAPVQAVATPSAGSTMPTPADPVTPVIDIAPEKPAEASPVPTAPPKPATIVLSVAPWGEVFVDGESKGVSPPLTRLELPAGKTRIEIRNDGAHPLVKELQLQEGKTVRMKHKF